MELVRGGRAVDGGRGSDAQGHHPQTNSQANGQSKAQSRDDA